MAFESVLGELQKEENIDATKILDNLLNPKNIDMKTHIISPVTFAVLEATIKGLENLLSETKKQKVKLPITKRLLRDMVKQLKMFLVSWNRESRKEVTRTLQSLRQEGTQDRSFYQKLLGLNK